MSYRQPFLFCFVLFSAWVSESAMALPIFAENRAIKTPSGTVLYPDSEDANLVYYFPGQGELVKDPRQNNLPSFGLTYWGLRKNASTSEITLLQESGGLLSFVARLYFTPEQLQEVEAIQKGGTKIAVLPVIRSTLEINSSAAYQKFFENIDVARHGGQADAQIGANVVLTGIGARAVVSLLNSPSTQVWVNYCYATQGLSPLFKATVKLNWSQIYETMKTSFSTGWFLARKEISVTIQKLIREGALDINIEKASGNEAKDEEFVLKFANMMIDRLFKADIPQSSTSNGNWSLVRFSLDYGRSEVRESITMNFTKRESVTQEYCVPVNVGGLKNHINDVVHSADGMIVH